MTRACESISQGLCSTKSSPINMSIQIETNRIIKYGIV